MSTEEQSGRDAALQALNEEIRQCGRCALRAGAQGVVVGEGAAGARIVFIGEGPGQEEDRLLRPFVGPAGRLLDRMLEAAGFNRLRECYILNTVKCRPPGNRAPTPEERLACWPNLRSQLRLLAPRIVVLLGATAVHTLLGKSTLSQARGRWHERGGVLFRATYHPAALLRNPEWKVGAWEDFQAIRDRYHEEFNRKDG